MAAIMMLFLQIPTVFAPQLLIDHDGWKGSPDNDIPEARGAQLDNYAFNALDMPSLVKLATENPAVLSNLIIVVQTVLGDRILILGSLSRPSVQATEPPLVATHYSQGFRSFSELCDHCASLDFAGGHIGRSDSTASTSSAEELLRCHDSASDTKHLMDHFADIAEELMAQQKDGPGNRAEGAK